MNLFKKKDVPDYDGEHDHAHPKKGRLWYNLKQRVVHRDIRGQRLEVTIRAGMVLRDGVYEAEAERTNRWTTLKPFDLESRGYRKSEGLYDSIIWWGVPVYVKLEGLKEFDITEKDDRGEYLYSQETPATLNDFLHSNATDKFIKGMTKTAFPEMDLHKLIMLGILICGVLFGAYMMGLI